MSHRQRIVNVKATPTETTRDSSGVEHMTSRKGPTGPEQNVPRSKGLGLSGTFPGTTSRRDRETFTMSAPARNEAKAAKQGHKSGLSRDDVEATALPTLSDPSRNRIRLLAACLMIFGNALGDSAAGALIPSIER